MELRAAIARLTGFDADFRGNTIMNSERRSRPIVARKVTVNQRKGALEFRLSGLGAVYGEGSGLARVAEHIARSPARCHGS